MVERLEREVTRALPEASCKPVTPAKATRRSTPDQLYDFDDAYGYRPNRPLDVYYLNPWEFLMLWEVRQMPKPAAGEDYELTKALSVWTRAGKHADAETELTAQQVVNETN